jgi:hypothetical protein
MTAIQAVRVVLALTCVSVAFDRAEAQSLGGSSGSLNRQNRVARQHDFTYLTTPAQLRRFVDAGYLVRIRDGRDHLLRGVAFPYARPEVGLFISRLGRQYRRACGEQLVVTSLTRPRTRQPRNASPRSVHPTGMAIDIRRSRSRACRSWLEDTLLTLEGRGVLEALRESRPPHYHVAVFPTQYASYVETVQLASAAGSRDHRVRRGDSLWTIARRYGTTVRELRSANKLRGSRIYAGQVLTVP